MVGPDLDDHAEIELEERRHSEVTALLKKAPRISTILALSTLVGLVTAAIGIRVSSDGTEAKAGLAVTNATVEALKDSVNRINRRVDSLGNQMFLSNYINCVQLRRTDPNALPPGCSPVLGRKP